MATPSSFSPTRPSCGLCPDGPALLHMTQWGGQQGRVAEWVGTYVVYLAVKVVLDDISQANV